MVAGNAAPPRAPGTLQRRARHLLPGRFGLRLEDIVVATETGRRAQPRPRPRSVVLIVRPWLDAGTFLLQWARRAVLLLGHDAAPRVSLGYGWLIRIVFGAGGVAGGRARRRHDHGRRGRAHCGAVRGGGGRDGLRRCAAGPA